MLWTPVAFALAKFRAACSSLSEMRSSDPEQIALGSRGSDWLAQGGEWPHCEKNLGTWPLTSTSWLSSRLNVWAVHSAQRPPYAQSVNESPVAAASLHRSRLHYPTQVDVQGAPAELCSDARLSAPLMVVLRLAAPSRSAAPAAQMGYRP